MDVLNALSMYYMGGTTNTAGAIGEMTNNMFTVNNGDRIANNNVGVVVTDGRYSWSIDHMNWTYQYYY